MEILYLGNKAVTFVKKKNKLAYFEVSFKLMVHFSF